MRNIWTFHFVLALLVLVVSTSYTLAAVVPQTLNYQATLTDNAGQPITGAKDVTISLYTVATGGAPFWTEQQTGVILKNGQFSVVLGANGANILDKTKLTGTTYIGIKVGTDTEMSPRQQFTSVAYALKSGDGVPIGAILMWSGAIDQIPQGWALCDGANGTPNLKDRFVVGAGNVYIPGSTGGSSSINLSHSHTVNSHTHPMDLYTYNDPTGPDYDDSVGDGSSKTPAGSDHRHHIVADTGAAAPGTNSQLSTAQSIIPPYYALAYIMKLQ
jgi:hypothetical protein